MIKLLLLVLNQEPADLDVIPACVAFRLSWASPFPLSCGFQFIMRAVPL
jgi:hypothetical protein